MSKDRIKDAASKKPRGRPRLWPQEQVEKIRQAMGPCSNRNLLRRAWVSYLLQRGVLGKSPMARFPRLFPPNRPSAMGVLVELSRLHAAGMSDKQVQESATHINNDKDYTIREWAAILRIMRRKGTQP